MAIETMYPSLTSNPDSALPASTTPAGAWTTVDVANGDAQKSGGASGSFAFSFGFTEVDASSVVLSNVLKFNYTCAGLADLAVYVSYDAGVSYSLLQALTDSTTTASITVTLDESQSIGDLRIGFVDEAAGLHGVTVDDLRLEVNAIAIAFKIVNDLAEEIIEEMGGRVNDAKMVRIVERWIDDVYKKIIAFHNWSWARETSDIDTVAAQDSYIVPIAAMHVSGFRKASGEKIHFRSREQLTNQGWDFTQTGSPLFWYSENISNGAMKVTLTPIPTTAETLTAYGTPRPLNLLTDDYIPLPTEFMPVLKDGVRAYYSRNDGHAEDGAMFDQLFGNGLMILRSRFAKEPDDYTRMSDTDIPNTVMTNGGRWPSNFPQ